MDGSTDSIAEQACKYSDAVGTGIPPDLVTEIAGFAKDATPTKYFEKLQDVPFWFEQLSKEGWEKRVGDIADLWVQDDGNIDRAAKQVGRPVKPPHRQLVRAFGIYRFKQPSTEQWKPLSQGPGMDDNPQTMVCIALEDLGPKNGFFFELQLGKDVCMDGQDRIWLPPTGGGLSLLIWIDL